MDAIPSNRGGAVFVRTLFELSMPMVAPTVSGTAVESVREESVRGEWVRAPHAVRTDAVVLYVHGGGFISCSPRTHRGLTSELSAATGLPIFSVGYRLAPEYPLAAARQDVLTAYRWLLRQGFAPDRIVVAGDSAGGRLVLDVVEANAANGSPQPGGIVLLSPLVDLTLEQAQRSPDAHRDAMFSIAKSREIIELAAHRRAPSATRSWRPKAARSLPPMMIHAAAHEFLVGDARLLAQQVRTAGGTCELTIWPDQVHAFPTMTRIAPEARAALRDVADFVGKVTAPAQLAATV